MLPAIDYAPAIMRLAFDLRRDPGLALAVCDFRLKCPRCPDFACGCGGVREYGPFASCVQIECACGWQAFARADRLP